jgi:Tfp pilus assembly protein PilF
MKRVAPASKRGCILGFFTLFLTVGFLSGCAHDTITSKDLVFGDPRNERRVEYLRNRLETEPGDLDARMELGTIFLNEEMMSEAIPQFEAVINQEPQNIQAYLLLSLALQSLPTRDLPRVTRLLEKAATIAPKNDEVHLNLAQVYDGKNAINEFNRVIELSRQPASLVSAHLGLMAIYARRGDSANANQEYERARDILPDVGKLIKQAEINRRTPPPRYAGEEYRGEDGIHPSLEERIRKLIEEYTKRSGTRK